MRKLFFAVAVVWGVSAGAQQPVKTSTLAGLLSCSRSLGLQPKAPAVNGKRDFVLPIRRDGEQGIFLFSETGVYYVDLKYFPERAFSVNFKAGNRDVKILGTKFDKNWSEFVVEDLAADKVIKPLKANAMALNNHDGARTLFENFLSEAIVREHLALEKLPAGADRKTKMLAFLKRTDACIDNVGQKLGAVTRESKLKMAQLVLHEQNPKAGLLRHSPSSAPHKAPGTTTH